MTNVSVEIIQYCAEEVERQRAKPIAVYWMVNAWMDAIEKAGECFPRHSLDSKWVENWGKLVDPIKNAEGFRTCMVSVGIHIPPGPEQVLRLMEQLFQPDVLETLDPGQVYKQFQEIHPFRDGNGRTGKIIFNWLSGTLEHPIMPPNFFGIANP